MRALLLACVMLLAMPNAASAEVGATGTPAATATVSSAPPEPRPALTAPKRGAFPMKPWSYARAYTYNFFADRAVQMRVLSDAGKWSEHIRSEQVIGNAIARRAAELVAATQGTIETSKCTFPRHAIVYFDQRDKPVASVDVCFDCEAVLASPDYPKPESYDWERATKRFEQTLPKWRKLFEGELGLPIDYKTAP